VSIKGKSGRIKRKRAIGSSSLDVQKRLT